MRCHPRQFCWVNKQNSVNLLKIGFISKSVVSHLNIRHKLWLLVQNYGEYVVTMILTQNNHAFLYLYGFICSKTMFNFINGDLKPHNFWGGFVKNEISFYSEYSELLKKLHKSSSFVVLPARTAF